MEQPIKDEFEYTANIASQRANAVSAIFNVIERLIDDKSIKSLCKHGALQASLAAHEMEYLADEAGKGFPADLQTGGA